MMSEKSKQFNLKHKDAFKKLGAIATLGWSAFDIRKSSKIEPKILVTSIWNFHGSKGHGHFAICKRLSDGTLWYHFSRPPLSSDSDDESDTRKWVAHWTSVKSALEKKIPIRGFLKDAKTGRCSLSNTFTCGPDYLEQTDGSIWLQLHPDGEVGCELGVFNPEELPSHISLAVVAKTFEDELVTVANMTADDRKARLAKFDGIPKIITVTTQVFSRNALVVYEALRIANGNCQACGNPAPFARQSDESPYLEVHHRIRLADGGRDKVENAEALCPNCHRAKHFGKQDS